MQFVKPMPFREAAEKLGQRTPIGSALMSAEWQDVPVALRERALFSSQVESVRFLQRAQDWLDDFLQGNRETLENGSVALKAGSRAQFVQDMREFALAEGMGPIDESMAGGLRDITSEPRLGLIFNTLVQQSNDYGYWRQGMDPDVLDEFPAQRFIRVKAVKQERESHQRYENQVYLKTDPIWAKVINEDFGVPWGPWAWGCGHDVEDVDRNEAEGLGLIKPGDSIQPDSKNFNENLWASTNGLEPELLDKLKSEFGDQLVIDGSEMSWQVVDEAAAAPQEAGNANPVSDALDLRVSGRLREDATAALAAIDKVHDDGTLPIIPVVSSNGPSYGTFHAAQAGSSQVAKLIELKAGGPWPALSLAHETGHFLDLEAIGKKGEFSSASGEPVMKDVMAAARKTDALKALDQRLANTMTARGRQYLGYLLSDVEVWARAYAQFIAERSGNKTLLAELKSAFEAEAHRQWSEQDFKPVADAIEKMFKQMGWI